MAKPRRPWTPEWDFGDRLRKVRLEYGRRLGHKVTVEEMAGLLGVASQTLSGWEMGSNVRHQRMVAGQMARVTGVDEAWILDDVEADSEQALAMPIASPPGPTPKPKTTAKETSKKAPAKQSARSGQENLEDPLNDPSMDID